MYVQYRKDSMGPRAIVRGDLVTVTIQVLFGTYPSLISVVGIEGLYSGI